MKHLNSSGRGAPRRHRFVSALLWAVAVLSMSALSGAEVTTSSSRATSNSSQLVRLPGHVHRLAKQKFDVGRAPSTMTMSLDLIVAKTPAQVEAFAQLDAELNDPKSPQYHHWLTPKEYGERFGASDTLLADITRWLQSQGLTVGAVPAARSHVPFTGTAAQVASAFHTEIHRFVVDSQTHYANISDPLVPAALSAHIQALRGLHDFYPKPLSKTQPVAPLGGGRAGIEPLLNYGTYSFQPHVVGPTDFATIYGLLPLYKQNITGSGVTVVITAESDIDTTIPTTYWNAFGVTGTAFGVANQSISAMTVPVASGGRDPGRTADGSETEAYLDVEIVGGLAPGASLILLADKSSVTAAQYAVDQNLGGIVTLSFGECESGLGTSGNSAVSAIYSQAKMQGMTVTVSSGDAGVATCDAKTDSVDYESISGYAVNGLASTPYNIAVGGTEWDPMQPQNWSPTNAPVTFASALSYIPEMVWNDTCANPQWATYFNAANTIALCNEANLPGYVGNNLITVWGGGGGLSSCISVDSTGGCSGGYTQPSWQANVPGIQKFGTRAVPDVALLAINWAICSYNTSPCDPGNPSPSTLLITDGTSAAAPAMAAIVALLDQSQITGSQKDGRQGLLADKLYALAAIEYGSASTLTGCNSSLGNSVLSGCVFYDVTVGNNDMPCLVSQFNSTGTLPASQCTTSNGYPIGIMQLSVGGTYGAGAGYDLGTGLGSINASNLVGAFQGLASPTGLAATASGTSVTLNWAAHPNATGFDLYQGTATGQEASTPIQSGITGTTATVSGLQNGQQYFFTIAAVTPFGTSAYSNEAQVTIVPAAPTGLAATASNGSVSLTWSSAAGAVTYNVYQGTAAGAEGSQPVTSGLSTSTATVNGLTNGTTYYFKVAAVNPGGTSSLSAEATATPAAPPPPPSSGGKSGGGAIDWLSIGMLIGVRALWLRRHANSRVG